MDTHMTHLAPELHASQSARLPGEPDLDAAPFHSGREIDGSGGHHPSGDDAHAVSDQPVPSRAGDSARAPVRQRRLGSLMTNVALGALILVAGGVLYLSPFNAVIPVPVEIRGLVDQAEKAIAGIVAPASSPAVPPRQSDEPGTSPSLAVRSPPTGSAGRPSTQARSDRTRDGVVAPAASLAATRLPVRPETVTAKPYAEQSRSRSLQEVMDLGASQFRATLDSPAKPADAAMLATPPSAIPVVSEPGSNTGSIAVPATVAPQLPSPPGQPAATKPITDITGPVTQAALDQAAAASSVEKNPSPNTMTALAKPATPNATATEPTAQPQTHAASAPPRPSRQDVDDHKQQVLVLAVPTGHQEQAEVLQYVTGLTGEVVRLRTENESLRKDVVRRMAEQESRLADYNRRLSVAEARAALKTAADTGRDEAAAGGSVIKTAAAVSSAPAPTLSASESRTSSAAGAKLRYRVQAASPGLALLAEVGRGGGEGAQLQVAVGDQIPGYGAVKSVAQRGPNWVVQTEHGSID